MKVGFIGLGIMGQPMALNLRTSGHDVWVHARRPAMMTKLIEVGATACATPAAVAENTDIIFICVSDTNDVEHVILSQQGILKSVKKDSIVVDMSTISPAATKNLAATLKQHHVHMLDAPVSGGEQGAIDGNLSIMVGGDEKIFKRALPLFEIMGKNIVHIGGHGAGQVAKACNQVLISQTIAAIGEAYILASASGVDPAKVRQALLGGFASSRALESHGQRMLDRNFKPGFKARLHQKDMCIAMEAADQVGITLAGAEQVTQYLNTVVEQGNGEKDSISIFEVQEQLSGITSSRDKK